MKRFGLMVPSRSFYNNYQWKMMNEWEKKDSYNS
jgi:hypothetical protein